MDYACRDDYGARPDTTSAWAGLFYFAARKAGPGEETRPVLTWPEGNGFLVDHLQDRCREQVRVSIAVTRLVPQPDGTVRVLAWDRARAIARRLPGPAGDPSRAPCSWRDG